MPIVQSFTLEKLLEAKSLIETIFLNESTNATMILRSEAIELQYEIPSALSSILSKLKNRNVIRADRESIDDGVNKSELWRIKFVDLNLLREFENDKISNLADLYKCLVTHGRQLNRPRTFSGPVILGDKGSYGVTVSRSALVSSQ